jgi:protein gp37
MGDKSNIEWTDATWNVITGCSVVSPGCTNCYAMRQAGTRLKTSPSYVGLTEDTKAGPVWNGKVRFNEKQVRLPLQWQKPRRIFVNSMGDLFHEDVPDEWIDRVFAVMWSTHWHVFQILTKRPERMRDYVREAIKHPPFSPGLPQNIWLGTSCEDQARADERVPLLLATPAAVRWVSAEPLLGPINFQRLSVLNLPDDPPGPSCVRRVMSLTGEIKDVEPRSGRLFDAGDTSRLDWIVVGSESGRAARPMAAQWARDIREQCKVAGVPFFMKQMSGRPFSAAIIKDIRYFPEDLKVREYPR